MCLTSERNNVVCGHRETFIEPCAKKRSNSPFLGRFRKCKPAIDSHFYFDICHECRRYWSKRNVTHNKAIDLTREYQLEHGDHGQIPPELVSARRNGILAKAVKGKKIDIDLHPLMSQAGRKESTCTLWPSLLQHEPSYPISSPRPMPQAHFRPESSISNMTGYGTIKVGFQVGMDSAMDLRNPNDFDLEQGDIQLQPLKPADINKPLPRPPRQGSPMPDRPFDPQNPDRDLPSNQFHSRTALSHPQGAPPRPGNTQKSVKDLQSNVYPCVPKNPVCREYFIV